MAVDNFKGGSRHAETEVIATFDRMIADTRFDPKRLIGATIHVVRDHVVCSDVCRPALRTWAADHEAKAVEGHLFTRPKYARSGQAIAKTTAETFVRAPPPLTHHQEKLY